MRLIFTDEAWEDYLYWQEKDKKILKKINKLIDDIKRNGNEGIGKPEALKHELNGYWSRRVNEKERLVYKFDDDIVYIAFCKGHYK